MIQDLRNKIQNKWSDMSVKSKLISAAVVVAIALIIIL